MINLTKEERQTLEWLLSMLLPKSSIALKKDIHSILEKIKK